MKTPERKDHRQLAEALRRRVLEGAAETTPAVRQAAAACATGERAPTDAIEALAEQIGSASYRVTDQAVAAVVEATGSQKAAFEIVAAAAAGAGLLRWATALRVLDEVADASV